MAFMSMANAFSKQPKMDVDKLPQGAESYWVHGGNLTPDASAEHAPGALAPLVDWYSGPITPPRELRSERSDFAPLYYKSRIEHGSFGSFSIEDAASSAHLPGLKSVQEKDLAEVVDKFHPAVRYRSFDEAFVKKEQWHVHATPEVLERQVTHACVSRWWQRRPRKINLQR